MNYKRLKWIAAPLALASTLGWMIADAQAFFGCFQRRMDTAAALYAGTGPCGGQRVVNYIPQTCYRVQYVQQAVTTYRPVCGADPCTGCPVTTMKPEVCYRPVAQLVPYTTYRLVYSALQPACPTTATTYYAPLATGPTSCGAGACATTAGYAAPTPYAAPAPAGGCSTCGTAPAATYSSGYSSGVRLGVPSGVSAPTFNYPTAPATTYAPGSVGAGSTTVYSYGTGYPQGAGGAYLSSPTAPSLAAPSLANPSGQLAPAYSSPGYANPAVTIESQAAPAIVNSAPSTAPTVSPQSNGAYSSGAYSGGTYSSGTGATGASGTPYSSGTATFAPSLGGAGGSSSSGATDGMTAVPPSTFMLPPMRNVPAAPPSPTAAPSPSVPVMPTPLPGAAPTPSAAPSPTPSMRPIPDPEVSPVGPTLGRPAATTPLLIDPKDQTAFAWPTRRAWGYAPIPGRVPVVAASYATVEGRPAHDMQVTPVTQSSIAQPTAPAVRAGDGWTSVGDTGGGWTPAGR